MTRYYCLVLLLFCSVALTAQQQNREGYLKAAQARVAQHDYNGAYQLYQIALDYDSSRQDIRFLVGENAYKARAYRVAEEALNRIAKDPKADTLQLTDFYLGELSLVRGDYEKSIGYFEQFQDEYPSAPAIYLSRARSQIVDADWAAERNRDPREVQVTHLPEGVNTPSSDFGYVIQGDQAYFTSVNTPFKKDTLVPIRDLSRLMIRTGENTSQPMSKVLNLENKLVANATFSDGGNRIYFSICEYIRFDEVRCDLYTSNRNEKQEWTVPVPLADLNVAGYSTTQPNVGMDEEGKSYLYFASNRPGGRGLRDIYRAPILDVNRFGPAEALTDINTEGDDMAPFYDSKRQTLFFTTDGRFTFGGLDLYKSYWDGTGFYRPINLGQPVNSSYDDNFYSRFDEKDKAYFASDRVNGETIYWSDEEEVCCYDIYEFVPDNRIDLLALTYDGRTKAKLEGATVGLYKLENGEYTLVEEIMNPLDNDFNFRLDPGGQYELRATRDGYTSAIDKFDLRDPEFVDKSFIRRELYLFRGIMLDVLTFRASDRAELNGTTVKLFAVSEDGTEELLDEVTNQAGNTFEFPLELGLRYVVRGEKTNFGPDEEEIDLRNVEPSGPATRIERRLYLGQLLEVYVFDSRTKQPLDSATVDLGFLAGIRSGERIPKTNLTDNYFKFGINLDEPVELVSSRSGYRTERDTLVFTRTDLDMEGGRLIYDVYLTPAGIDNLLPLRLFFDNNVPNPNLASSQRIDYGATYEDYYGRKTKFIEEFTQGMPAEEAFTTGGRFNDFFNLQVQGGWDDLKYLSEQLVDYLADGNRLTLTMKGYSSPRASDAYNKRLAGVRIKSVERWFERYDNGVLLPYIRRGDLSFRSVPLGESQATEEARALSDRLEDSRVNVYSIIASLERRVEIIDASTEER